MERSLWTIPSDYRIEVEQPKHIDGTKNAATHFGGGVFYSSADIRRTTWTTVGDARTTQLVGVLFWGILKSNFVEKMK